MPKNRKKNMPRPAAEEPYIKDFLDMVAPSVIDFKVDHYLCGDVYKRQSGTRCGIYTMSPRRWPPSLG